MSFVRIFDTTLRDGEQSPGAAMSPSDRLRIARLLAAAGADVIEAGFPAASPLVAASVAEIAAAAGGTTVAALARCTEDDVDAAIAALRPAARPRVHVFIATSDVHIERKLRTTKDEVLRRTRACTERARAFTADVEFSAEDASRSDRSFLIAACRVAVEAGATTINLPDTVGFATPGEYAAMFRDVGAALPANVVLSAHTHDDLGLATANALAAIEAGARQVECAVNGIGERAGNAALEEIVVALRVRADAYPYRTAFRSEALSELSAAVASATRMPVQKNKAVVGANAFAHESGIHQDGFLKDRRTYEIVDPATVGARAALTLGRNSGRHALFRRAEELGIALDEHERAAFSHAFAELAAQRSEVGDADLLAIAATLEAARGAFAVR